MIPSKCKHLWGQGLWGLPGNVGPKMLNKAIIPVHLAVSVVSRDFFFSKVEGQTKF